MAGLSAVWLMVLARVKACEAACPACGAVSGRVHSRYARRLADAAVGGRRVVIRLTVRRFFCPFPDCKRRTFAGQVPGLTARYGRKSAPLAGVLRDIAVALAGRAGSRLAAALGAPASRQVLLRLVMAAPEPQTSALWVLGVDDFAIRRGQNYGTVIIDCETGAPLDLLEGRDAQPLAGWLAAHPGVEVICRDRSGSYADGARTGAPQAIQVADRFHLWQNLAKAVERCAAAHRACLDEPDPAPAAAPEPAPPGPAPAARPDPAGKYADRARRHHATVHGLLAEGRGLQEITALGYDGSYPVVRDYLAQHRPARTPLPPAPPTVREVTGWITRRPGSLTDDERPRLKAILERCPELRTASEQVRAFAVMITQLTGQDLPQ